MRPRAHRRCASSSPTRSAGRGTRTTPRSRRARSAGRSAFWHARGRPARCCSCRRRAGREIRPAAGSRARAAETSGRRVAYVIGSSLSVSEVTIPRSPKQPAAVLRRARSETRCSLPRALTNSTSATRSLSVLCRRPAPWQIGALLPPQVISTMTTFSGTVHAQAPPFSSRHQRRNCSLVVAAPIRHNAFVTPSSRTLPTSLIPCSSFSGSIAGSAAGSVSTTLGRQHRDEHLPVRGEDVRPAVAIARRPDALVVRPRPLHDLADPMLRPRHERHRRRVADRSTPVLEPRCLDVPHRAAVALPQVRVLLHRPLRRDAACEKAASDSSRPAAASATSVRLVSVSGGLR